MGKYFSDHSAIETLMDVAINSQNTVDEQAEEIIPNLAEEASAATCKITGEFLKGFHKSEEYTAALIAYPNGWRPRASSLMKAKYRKNNFHGRHCRKNTRSSNLPPLSGTEREQILVWE